MTTLKTILLVDGEATLAKTLAEQFRLGGEFALEHVVTADEAARRLARPGIDLVLMEGEAMAGFVTSLPVLPLAKPLRLAHLLATMREALRIAADARDGSLTIGAFQFDPESKLLIGSDQTRIRLTEKEAAILAFLQAAGGEIVPREALLAEIWGYGAGITTHTLETHVYRLRRKIEAAPGAERRLISEAGGYRLRA